jgi:F-type H+-transporting ATPase subunit delta
VLSNYKINELTNGFIKLLVTKGRELNLPEIAGAFIDQYNDLKNIRVVKLTTAAPMADNITAGIQEKIAGYMPKDTIDLKTAIDEELIGGFVLEVEDKLYDASVRKSLNEIRSKIIDTSYVSKM